jgi:Uma2 family endonuclease
MSAIPKDRWTAADYLAFERDSDIKHEFWNGQIVAMTGATRRHNLIAGSVYASLYNQTVDRPCEVYVAEMRVHIAATGLYTYPDVAAVCGEIELEDDQLDTLLNPDVIIEVLSPSTEGYDRGRKFQQYRSISTLKEYILITQDRPTIERFMPGASGKWELTEAVGLEAILELPSIKCTLALADVYRKVTFDDKT